jgi:LmbE family N-acetylglucosaminyl deacetylase
VGAHQDDLEILALPGILAGRVGPANKRGFAGVVVTDGAGSPRSGRFAAHSDDEMKDLRAAEQESAARLGGYELIVQLGRPSAAIKAGDAAARADLEAILRATRPRVVYTHNLADRHVTHVAVALDVVETLRRLPDAGRPAEIYGCEVWRGLDWLAAPEKVRLAVEDPEDLGVRLLAVFETQVGGGKRYDLAARGRRLANATFDESHHTDRASQAILAMDLSPLVRDPGLSPEAFVQQRLDRARAEILQPLVALTGRSRPG